MVDLYDKSQFKEALVIADEFIENYPTHAGK